LAALTGFGTQWAYFNALIPGVYFPIFAATVLAARLVGASFSMSRPMHLLGAVVVALLGWQNLHAPRPTEAAVPTSKDRSAAVEFLSVLKTLPGPLFIPRHPFYSVLAGKEPFVHFMELVDTKATFGRPASVDQAVDDQKFAAIVLDDEPRRSGWPRLETRYHVAQRFSGGLNTVHMFTGYATQPRLVLLRNVP
jgi:hypothetical protein